MREGRGEEGREATVSTGRTTFRIPCEKFLTAATSKDGFAHYSYSGSHAHSQSHRGEGVSPSPFYGIMRQQQKRRFRRLMLHFALLCRRFSLSEWD